MIDPKRMMDLRQVKDSLRRFNYTAAEIIILARLIYTSHESILSDVGMKPHRAEEEMTFDAALQLATQLILEEKRNAQVQSGNA